MIQDIEQCLKNMFRYSFQGPMVGKKENEFLTWDELTKNEQICYGNESTYDQVVNWAKL